MKRTYLIPAFLFLVAIPASAQIGTDAPTAYADGGTGTTITIPLTITTTSAHDTELVVGCGIVDGSAAAIISTATWLTSNSLTKVSSQPTGTGWNTPSGQPQNRTETWGELAPPTGTGNVVVTLAHAPTGGYAESACSATVYVRVNQSLTPDAKNETSNGGVSSEPAGTVTTNYTYDWVIDTVMNAGGVTNPQATTPSSRQWVSCIYPCAGFANTFAGSMQIAPTAATITMAWAGMNNGWSQNIIALKWDGVTAPGVLYYLANAAGGGSDSNSGTSSGSPWLTPNHSLNCGDVILAAAGTYAETNFRTAEWGNVTCIAGNNVAWLKCATFDSCYISIASSGAYDTMTPTQSYWGVQGWEVTANSAPSTNGCFEFYPPSSSVQIHHLIFANDICNGAGDGCFFTGSNGSVGTDYVVFIGNICYNGAQDNANCYSGFDIVDPVNSDSLPGTHYYIAGNFSWGTVNPNPCSGSLPTDGQGIALDTTITTSPGVQFVIENNISIFNGGTGVQTFDNTNASPNHVYIAHNTTFGNHTGNINANPCPEINVFESKTTEVFFNITQASSTNHCVVPGPTNIAEYCLGSSSDYTTDIFWTNFCYSPLGNNTSVTNARLVNNLTGTSPSFANPVEPSAPSCGSFASVPACMATVIANFTPMTAAAKGYGYQIPTSAVVVNPLFPQWLCSVTNLPAGLIQMGCGTGHVIGPGTTLSY